MRPLEAAASVAATMPRLGQMRLGCLPGSVGLWPPTRFASFLDVSSLTFSPPRCTSALLASASSTDSRPERPGLPGCAGGTLEPHRAQHRCVLGERVDSKGPLPAGSRQVPGTSGPGALMPILEGETQLGEQLIHFLLLFGQIPSPKVAGDLVRICSCMQVFLEH